MYQYTYIYKNQKHHMLMHMHTCVIYIIHLSLLILIYIYYTYVPYDEYIRSFGLAVSSQYLRLFLHTNLSFRLKATGSAVGA